MVGRQRCFRAAVLVSAAVLLIACSAGAGPSTAPATAPRGPAAGAGGRFEFGVIGDYPYGADQFPKFDRLITAVNEEGPALVLHVGDVGGKPCDDAALNTSLATLHHLTMPVLYTPGDNEWTDCASAGADPLQRLARVRQLYFRNDQSLGQRTLTLTRQSAAYPENTRVDFDGITFVGLHWVGSNNGTGRTPELDAEAAARSTAGLAWVQAGFAAAKAAGSRGIVIFFQADPNFDLYRLGIRNAHTELLRTFEREAIAYGKPVLLVHGDTHLFRVDQPLYGTSDTPIANVTRLENFGSPNVHWSRVTVDPDGPALFTFSPGIVAGNSPENAPR